MFGCGIWSPCVAGVFDISWKVTLWVINTGVGNVVVLDLKENKPIKNIIEKFFTYNSLVIEYNCA